MFLIKWRILLIITLLGASSGLRAQSEEKQLPLTEYLSELQDDKNVTFSYDAELLEGFQIRYIHTNQPLERILNALDSQLPFSFNVLKESYITVQSKRVSLNLQIKDELTGGSVPGVYVKKNDQYTDKISDSKGYINLQLDWRKGDTLSFEFLGYQKQKILVKDLLLSGESSIYLKEGTTVLNELIISGYMGAGIDAHQRNHSLNIKTEDLGILPGDNNKDLLVSLRALPGISTVTGMAGDLRIRGGTPDQTLLLYNNIPIYHKGYYYGTISPFSTDIVDEVKVYRSGFTPRLGGRVGGAIEINTDNKIPEKVVGGLASSSVYSSGFIKTPIVKDQLGLSISVRTSHPFDFISPIEKEYEIMALAASQLQVRSDLDGVDRNPVSFDFRDISSVLSWAPTQKDELVLNFLSISNENRIKLVDNNVQTDLDYRTSLINNGLNFQWNRKWGKWKSSFFLTNALYDYQVNNQEFMINTDQVNRFDKQANILSTLKTGSIFSTKNDDNYNELILGYEATRLKSSISLEQFNRRDVPQGPRGNPKQQATVHSIFGNFYIPDINKFMFDLGLRANYYTGNESLRLEPRLFMNYHLSDRITFKTSAGFYSQFIARNVFFDFSDLALDKLIWQLVVNREDEIIKSSQFLAGLSYQSNNWLFDFDAYVKRVDNITTNGPIIEGPDVPGKLIGLINSHGMDFLVKRKIRNVNLWVNYTLSKVGFEFDALKTEEFPANYDQRHLFNISAIYQLNQFRASIGWLYGSGVPNYLGDNFFPSVGGAGREPLPPPTAVGEIQRFDATHQLDASFAYEFLSKSKKMKITTGVSFLNIYDRQNLLETVNITIGRPAENVQSNRYTIGFAPDMMIKIEWL